MATYLSDDLKMAEVNAVKVVEADKAIKEAEAALDKQLLSNQEYLKIKDTLDKVNELEDHQITPEVVNSVDNTINEVANMVVDAEGKPLVVISGTENFGFTLTPKMWRADRIAGMESLLEEIARNIKRWANQLNGNLRELWDNFTTSIEVLEKRSEQASVKLDMLYDVLPGKETVKLSGYITASLMIDNKVPNEVLVKYLTKEINYITMVLKTWEQESIVYKNSIFKYFGNTNSSNLPTRPMSKLFNKRDTSNKSNFFKFNLKDSLIGNHNVEYSLPSNESKENIESYSVALSETGYFLLSNGKDFNKDLTMGTLSIDELNLVLDKVRDLISLLKILTSTNSPVNLSENDVKDVLNTNKKYPDTEKLSAYGLVSSSYQSNVDKFRADVAKWLTLLTSHLITMLFINMEAYDES